MYLCVQCQCVLSTHQQVSKLKEAMHDLSSNISANIYCLGNSGTFCAVFGRINIYFAYTCAKLSCSDISI